MLRNLNKNICHQIVYSQITPVVSRKGYIVKTNTCTVDDETPIVVSKFFKSRPDVIINHPTKLQATVAQVYSDSEVSEEED